MPFISYACSKIYFPHTLCISEFSLYPWHQKAWMKNALPVGNTKFWSSSWFPCDIINSPCLLAAITATRMLGYIVSAFGIVTMAMGYITKTGFTTTIRGSHPHEWIGCICSSMVCYLQILPQLCILILLVRCNTAELHKENSGFSGNGRSSDMEFRCARGYLPSNTVLFICMDDGQWIPDPDTIECTRGTVSWGRLQKKNSWLGYGSYYSQAFLYREKHGNSIRFN